MNFFVPVLNFAYSPVPQRQGALSVAICLFAIPPLKPPAIQKNSAKSRKLSGNPQKLVAFFTKIRKVNNGLIKFSGHVSAVFSLTSFPAFWIVIDYQTTIRP